MPTPAEAEALKRLKEKGQYMVRIAQQEANTPGAGSEPTSRNGKAERSRRS